MDDKMATADNSTYDCVSDVASLSIFRAWFAAYLLFLPVFLFVLYIGFDKWKKPQSSSSGGLSHSDVFTLHTVAMELMCIIGECIGFYLFTLSTDVQIITEYILLIIVTGQVLFHCLTCVERYLAVVHPVTYLRLRREGGVTVRNISIALVWVMSVFFCLVAYFSTETIRIYCFMLIILSVLLVTYCSVCVLRVLVRPKPGDGGGQRRRSGQSMRSTVYTMAAILGVLLMRLAVSVVRYSVSYAHLQTSYECAMAMLSNVFSLPSSLVLPLLFLHRSGKLPGCCNI